MNKKLKIGDKVYASLVGPESKGTVIEIEERDDKQLIKIELDKSIKFFMVITNCLYQLMNNYYF